MALALHGIWIGKRFYIWGDAPRAGGAAGAARAAPADAVREALGEWPAAALLAAAAPAVTLQLTLPCDEAGTPLAPGATSPAAPTTQPATPVLVTLQAAHWLAVDAPALAFAPAAAVDLLTSLPAAPVAAADPAAPVEADSLRYWALLARFATSLLARRQFVPHVAESSTRLVATWRPVIQDRAELEWLERFAAAMPPVCRSAAPVTDPSAPSANSDDLDDNGTSADAANDAARLIERFLGAVIDATVRRAVADDPFFCQPADRALQPLAPPETRWLAALLGSEPSVAGGSAEENALLVQMGQAWVGQLEPTGAASAWRLTFRLAEPPDPPEPAAPLATADHHDSAPPNGDDAVGAVAAEPTFDADLDDMLTDAVWRLHLELQPPDDAGPPLPAEELWRSGVESVLLGRNLKDRRARLLAELVRAAEVYPVLRELLAQPVPTGLDLATPEAYAFIRQWSGPLRDQGFGVVLPSWADRGQSELGLRLMVRPLEELPADWDYQEDQPTESGGAPARRGGSLTELASGHFGLDSLLEFDWQIALGRHTLTASEFERLAMRKSPLVRLRGQWVQVDAAATEQARQFLAAQRGKRITLVEALRTAYGAARTQTGLPVLGLDGASWVDQLLQQAPGARMESLAQPAGFAGTLRPYQLRGLQWLVFLDRLGIGACLADDMGLGKTIQLIALLLHERERSTEGSGFVVQGTEQGSGSRVQGSGNAQESTSSLNPEPQTLNPSLGPTLLFAPTSVVGNWVREVQRFARSLRVLVHHGPERLGGEAFVRAAAESDLVVTSYALAHRDREDLSRVRWRRIALDEAQKIKNPSAASTIAIRALAAGRRVALTGTPIENHLSELWSIMEILNPGLLGSAADFRERFAVPIEKLGERDRSEALRRLVRPFVLRRLKSDPEIAGDLPEKMEAKVFCNLTPEQAAQYERTVSQSLVQIDAATGIRRRGLILSVLTRLKQICNHPTLPLKDPTDARVLSGRSGKCERLIEMLEEVLDERDAALVFTQFREMGHLLERLIQERLNARTLFLHGGTPARRRDEMIEQFQAGADGVRIFILSLRAGGLGLNLTAANHVFHFDRWWNPAVEQQATDRAHRVGQTRNVQVHKFVCIGTMEERIDRLLTEKLALADRIIGAGDEWLTNLTTEQLRDYLALSREAIGEF